MGDGGIGQDALDAILQERQQVAGDHGQHRHGRDDGEGCAAFQQFRAPGEAQQHGEHGRLGDCRQIAGDGRRSALIDIRRPHVEGNQGQLEGDARHQDGLPRRQPGFRPAGRGEGCPGFGEQHGSRGVVDERHAEQHGGAAHPGEHQIFQRRFQGRMAVFRVGHQSVEADGNDLHAQQQAGEMLSASQRHGPQGSQGQEDEAFLLMPRPPFQIAAAEQRGGQPGDQEQAAEEGCVAIEDEQRRHLSGRRLQGRKQGQESDGEGRHGHRQSATMTAPERYRQHQDQRPGQQGNMRRQRQPIQGGQGATPRPSTAGSDRPSRVSG